MIRCARSAEILFVIKLVVGGILYPLRDRSFGPQVTKQRIIFSDFQRRTVASLTRVKKARVALPADACQRSLWTSSLGSFTILAFFVSFPFDFSELT